MFLPFLSDIGVAHCYYFIFGAIWALLGNNR